MFKKPEQIKPLHSGMENAFSKTLERQGFKSPVPAHEEIKLADVIPSLKVESYEEVDDDSCECGDDAEYDSKGMCESCGKPHAEGYYEALDPVNTKALKKDFTDRKDKDIDNDGDTDSSDEYLHKRRKAISKALAKESAGLGEAYKGKNPDNIKSVGTSGASILAVTNAGNKYTLSAKDTGGKMPKAGEPISKYVKESVEIDETYKGKNPDNIKSVGTSGGSILAVTNAGNKYTLSAKDTGGKMPKAGEPISKYVKESVTEAKQAIVWKVKPPKGQKNIHPDSKWPGMKPGDIEKMNVDPKDLVKESVELDEATKEGTIRIIDLGNRKQDSIRKELGVDGLPNKGFQVQSMTKGKFVNLGKPYKDMKSAEEFKRTGQHSMQFEGLDEESVKKDDSRKSHFEIVQDGGKVEVSDIQEAPAYALYHNTFSGAVQEAIAVAKKQGFEIDEDDWSNKVATGPKKPSKDKTNSYTIDLMKGGKPAKKKLHMQVYNMGPKYELNCYVQ
jgi:hypothetical protein